MAGQWRFELLGSDYAILLKALLKTTIQKLKILCLAIVLTVLTSCGMFAQVPPDTAVFQAITQQQIDMQSAVAEGLNISTKTGVITDFKVGKVSIESREKILDPEIKKQAASQGA